ALHAVTNARVHCAVTVAQDERDSHEPPARKFNAPAFRADPIGAVAVTRAAFLRTIEVIAVAVVRCHAGAVEHAAGFASTSFLVTKPLDNGFHSDTLRIRYPPPCERTMMPSGATR